MQPPRTALYLALLALPLAAACPGRGAERSAAAPSAPASDPPELRLLLLSDPAGVLEPCGCTSRPLGGVDRLVGEARRLAADGVPTLLLSAGDLFTGAPEEPFASPPGEAAEAHRGRVARWRRETFAEALRRAGLRAGTWGPADAALPSEEREALARRSGARLLGGAPVATARLSAGEIVVGVVAAGPEASPEQVAEAARSLRAEGARLVVALVVDRRAGRARRIAALPEVDLALLGGGHNRRLLPPDVVQGGLLVHAGRHLQGLAVVEFRGLEAQGPWVEHGPWRRRLRREQLRARAEELRERLAAWEREGRSEAQLAEQRSRLKELERRLAADRGEPSPISGRRASVRWVELGPEVAGDPEARALLDELSKRINEGNREAYADWRPPPPGRGEPYYVGAERCGSCHAAAYRWWRGTPHGRAYATLERGHKQFHLECVGCHVTGYGERGGATVVHVERLKDVGCEVCHGPGGNRHASHPGRFPPERGRQVPESVCVRCHNEEHSDRFDYRRYVARLRAPGHGLPAAAPAGP